MRRLVHHALAGAGLTVATAVVAVGALGGPDSSRLSAVPAPAVGVIAPADPAAAGTVTDATRTDRIDRETREAERVRLSAAATRAAQQRAADLAAQGEAVAQQQASIAAARAKAAVARRQAAAARQKAAAAAAKKAAAAAAKKAAAKAAAARKAAEAEKKAAQARQAAEVKARGYEAGVTDPRVMARQILANKFGYGADQYSCFNYIIMRESMWDVHATNAASGAYGIPQALPGSKMASVASDWRTNPATQIIWGIGYMKDRYGSPCAAKSFKAAHGWY